MEVFRQRLEAALAAEAGVIEASCSLKEDEPFAISPAGAIVGTGKLSEEDELALVRARRRPDRGKWVEIIVRVAAPTRRQAFDLASTAVWRAHAATGEHPAGWTGQIDIRQVD